MPSITFGNALQHYFVSRFRRLSLSRKKRLEKLKGPSDAQEYIRSVREKIKGFLHLPENKCPLEPRVTGRMTFPGFILEKVTFQSRPGFTVTGNFHLPANPVTGPLPAVIYLCGHAPDGKASSMYQKFCRSLAMRGFAVLISDPVGQGERRQLPRELAPTEQHNITGKQLHLVGEDLFSWRINDAMRSVDYLLTRPEVDSSRIFICGESGGGTLTTWMTALEERAAGFVISSAVTTWLHNVENEVAVDIEQIPPGAAAEGLDLADFIIAGAPKPLLLLGGKKDFFDPRGFEEINEELKKIYALLGHSERLDSLLGEDHHGLYQPLREKGYGFLCRFANLPDPGREEGEVPVSSEEELWAAPEGSVHNLPGEKKIHEFAAEKLQQLKDARRELSFSGVRKSLKKILGIKKIKAPFYRTLSYRYHTCCGSYQNYSRFGLETEPGEVMCILHRLAKKSLFYNFAPPEGKITLYIPHADSVSELQLREPAPGDALYSLDCRGCGECTSTACDQMPELDLYYYYGINYHFPSLHLLWKEDMCGKRVTDILSALELIAPGPRTVTLEARGHGCIYALPAALFSPKITELRLFDCPSNWEEIVTTLHPAGEKSPLAILPGNILSVTDIPGLIKVVRAAGVTVIQE